MQVSDSEVGVMLDTKAMREGRSKEGGASYVHVFVLGTDDEICRP